MTRAELITRFTDGGYMSAATILTHLGRDASKVAGVVMDGVLPEFSRDCPRIVSLPGSWDGTAVALPGRIPSTSVTVEAPTGTQPRTYLSPVSLDIDDTDATLALIGVPHGTAYRVLYAALHTIPADGAEGTVTIPDEKVDPFLWLATSHIARRISVAHGATARPDIAADSVNYLSKSAEYERIAKAAYATYRTALGLPDKPAPRAFAVAVPMDGARRTLPATLFGGGA